MHSGARPRRLALDSDAGAASAGAMESAEGISKGHPNVPGRSSRGRAGSGVKGADVGAGAFVWATRSLASRQRRLAGHSPPCLLPPRPPPPRLLPSPPSLHSSSTSFPPFPHSSPLPSILLSPSLPPRPASPLGRETSTPCGPARPRPRLTGASSKPPPAACRSRPASTDPAPSPLEAASESPADPKKSELELRARD